MARELSDMGLIQQHVMSLGVTAVPPSFQCYSRECAAYQIDQPGSAPRPTRWHGA
jgi:hypothetical protein